MRKDVKSEIRRAKKMGIKINCYEIRPLVCARRRKSGIKKAKNKRE